MADSKPTPASSDKAKAAEQRGAADSTDASKFPNTHTEGGRGTVQTEPKPEDYPADLRMAPPAEQLAPNAKPVVGTQGDTIADSTDEAISEGIDAHAEHIAKVKEDFDEKHSSK